jgi:hypothetical protein
MYLKRQRWKENLCYTDHGLLSYDGTGGYSETNDLEEMLVWNT